MAQALDLVVDRRVLLDVEVLRGDVGLGLVVVVVADEVLDRVLGEELAELVAELGGQRLVVRDHQRRALDSLDRRRHREGLARAGRAEQGLEALVGAEARGEPLDRLGLVRGGRVRGVELELGHWFQSSDGAGGPASASVRVPRDAFWRGCSDEDRCKDRGVGRCRCCCSRSRRPGHGGEAGLQGEGQPHEGGHPARRREATSARSATGEGFAYAQDNACLLLDTVVDPPRRSQPLLRHPGPRAQLLERRERPQLQVGRLLEVDRGERRPRRSSQKGFSKQAKQLYRGWVEGFNAYLALRQASRPGLPGQAVGAEDHRQRPDPARHPGPDQRRLRQPDLRASTTPSHRRPPAPRGRRSPPPSPDIPALREQIQDLAGESDLGSNGLGLGSDATSAAPGCCCRNPHFPWRGIDRFWMAHLTVKGKGKKRKGAYDAMGGHARRLPDGRRRASTATCPGPTPSPPAGASSSAS